MNIYTFFTPSHSILYENYFSKTLPSNFSLKTFESKIQDCISAEYYDEGWTKTTKKKIEILISACEENMGSYFVYSDVDVQFFCKDIVNILLDEIQDKDIACQDDNTSYCSGFFICRANTRTLKMFKTIYDEWNYKDSDQKMLNKNLFLCNHKKLSRKFFTVGHLIKKPWTGQDLIIPSDIYMHHANWVVGIENKISLLNLVRNKILL